MKLCVWQLVIQCMLHFFGDVGDPLLLSGGHGRVENPRAAIVQIVAQRCHGFPASVDGDLFHRLPANVIVRCLTNSGGVGGKWNFLQLEKCEALSELIGVLLVRYWGDARGVCCGPMFQFC